MRFRGVHRIIVDYGPPYGVIPCHATLVSVEDLTEYEPGEDADRSLKAYVQLTLEGYLVEDARRVPTVRKEVIGFSDDLESEEILEQLEYSV